MNAACKHKPQRTPIGFLTEIRPDGRCANCPEFREKASAQKYVRSWQTMQPDASVR